MADLVVLVPVLNRPQNVAPLVESFRAGCPTDAHLYFIAEEHDTAEIAAIRKIEPYQHVLITLADMNIHTWPQKINLGVSAVDADWYLCAADDVSFTPGWWEATAELRDDPSIGVIGTNDSADGTGNQAVAEGTHTCHPLIRATYIRNYGTWDEPGKAACEQYRHYYVDNEIVITAKMRRAWAFCREAVLEHNHPFWKPEVPWDETYQLGNNAEVAEMDKQTWFRRAAEFGPLQPYAEDDPRCTR